MNLIIFDIDGTLCNSQRTEDYCFKKAYEECLGIDIWELEWHTLKHVTDWGISNEIYVKHFKRDISIKEIDQFRNRFIELLQIAYQKDDSVFTEVAGARDFFQRLQDDNNYRLAVATGSWSDSARIKLRSIEIDFENLPFAHSDKFMSREEIVEDAIRQSKEKYESEFDKIVYFGDGEWDFKTCLNLNIPFIGLDCNHNGRLINLGVEKVIHNYLDHSEVLRLIAE